jgi:hypothetical protein
MGIFTEIANMRKGHNCERMVKYTGNEITVSGAAITAGSYTVNLGNFSNKIKEITKVPDVLIILDNLQYQYCVQASKLDKNNPLKEQLSRIIIVIITNITMLHTLVGTPKPDKRKITEWIQYSTEIIKECNASIMPSRRCTSSDGHLQGAEPQGKLETSITHSNIKGRILMRKAEPQDELEETEEFITNDCSKNDDRLTKLLKQQGLTKEDLDEAVKILIK